MLALLDQKHSNICNSLDYLYPSNSNPLCVSGGYDCKVLLWDIQQQILLKTVDMREQFKKWKLPLGNSYPFVHHVLCTKDRVLLSMESGHVIALNAIQLNKPMFML